MRRDSIACQTGRIGPLAYTPPEELGQGREVRGYGRGGFALVLTDGPSDNSAPMPVQRVVPLSFAQARLVANDMQTRWPLAFTAMRDQPLGPLAWVEQIIADLPLALEKAIDAAAERVTELRVMRAAATGRES